MKMIPLTLGSRFGELTVLERAGTKQDQVAWRVQCACGSTLVVRSDRLRSGKTRSCGCVRAKRGESYRARRRRITSDHEPQNPSTYAIRLRRKVYDMIRAYETAGFTVTRSDAGGATIGAPDGTVAATINFPTLLA